MLTFLKLGGSLITNKDIPETARVDRIERIVQEIRRARQTIADQELIIGHGSGSYGHVFAKRHNTINGVSTVDGWHGFTEVAAAASRLSHIFCEAFINATVPILRIQPSASAQCKDGTLVELNITSIQSALAHGLVPVVHGDVAFDSVRGGTIISTEAVFLYLATQLKPDRILLAGDYNGVLDAKNQAISKITSRTVKNLEDTLGGSSSVDVTGGMRSKVLTMLDLCAEIPGLSIHIFNGNTPGLIEEALVNPDSHPGTQLSEN